MSHIHLATPLPHTLTVAVSGGIDSMTLLAFLLKGHKKLTALHFDHGTEYGKEARQLVEAFCHTNKVPLVVQEITGHNEETWRNQRLYYSNQYLKEHPEQVIATAHHLQDATEWWIYTSMKGKPNCMQAITDNGRRIKPFLYTYKVAIKHKAKQLRVPFLNDPTNETGKNMRAIMRRDILPSMLKIHPGMMTSIKKRVMEANKAVGV